MKKPAREPVDMLRQERTELAEEVRNIIDSTVQRILGDPVVWVEEASREGAPPLPWPCSMRGKGFAQLMGMVFDTAVENVLQAIEDDRGAQWAPPRDTADEDFQRVLQLAKRATDSAEIELRKRFGGTGRVPLKRELLKLVREHEAEVANRTAKQGGAARKEFAAAGLSKSAAYRALIRARER